MTTAGFIVMSLSVTTVVSLFAWCIWRVLTSPRDAGNVHAREFETPDVRQDR